MHRSARVVVVGMLSLVSSAVLAGPLNPPAGPVASSPTPPGEIEPRRNVNTLPGGANAQHVISQSGSYYLSADIQVSGAVDGIRVEADNVTIDLNGFSLISTNDMTFAGVNAQLGSDLTVLNGWIRGFDTGIRAFDSGLVEGVSVTDSRASGFALTNFAVRGCRAERNMIVGFSLEQCSVSACIAFENASNGFFASRSTLVDCIAVRNGTEESPPTAHSDARDDGARVAGGERRPRGGGSNAGFLLDFGTIVRSSYAGENIGDGFNANGFGDNSVYIFDCVSERNGGDGYDGLNSARVHASVATQNTMNGFLVDANAHVEGCYAFANDGDGFNIPGMNAHVVGNNAQNNLGFGFNHQAAGLLAKNTATGNAPDFSPTMSGAFPVSVPAPGVGPWDNIDY